MSGGIGAEREVSLASGKSCAKALRDTGVLFEEIIVEKDTSFLCGDRKMTENEGLEFLEKENALVFQVIHGTYGEDGELVKKLETNQIACIGSTSDVLEMTINKYKTEVLLRKNKIPTTESVLATSISDISVVKGMVFPVIIKPNKEGSSVGVIKVDKEEDLNSAVEKSLEICNEILVQTCIQGREFTCGVLEIGGENISLTPSEVVLEDGMLFDYHAKYFVNGLEITPANVDEDLKKRIQDTAHRVHTVTGCRDISRTDMILNERDELVVLEINTIPGMTDVSFIPAEMKASGYSLKDFVEGMIKKYSK